MEIRKIKTGLWAAAAVAAALFVAVLAVTARYDFYAATLKYGLIFFCILLVAFLVWKAFIQRGREDLKRSEREGAELRDQIAELQGTVRDLSRELAEKSRSRINVVDLNPILHVAVMKIDTSFTRTYVREQDGLTFEGALRADICAEYGVKLEDARFRYDEASNTLAVACFHPGLISFSKKQLNWDIAHAFHARHILGLSLPAMSDPAADAYAKRLCEELRSELEREIDERKVAEFDWLSPMIRGQVLDFLKILIGRDSLNIVLVDETEAAPGLLEEFVDLPSLRRQVLAMIPAGNADAEES